MRTERSSRGSQRRKERVSGAHVLILTRLSSTTWRRTISRSTGVNAGSDRSTEVSDNVRFRLVLGAVSRDFVTLFPAIALTSLQHTTFYVLSVDMQTHELHVLPRFLSFNSFIR